MRTDAARRRAPFDPSLGGFEAQNGLCLIRELTADDAPTAQVAAFQVRHEDFARRTLYSWTTAEQVGELRANPTLLTRAASAEGEPGRAAEVIQLHAESDELAALLAEPRFENKRFGWSNAWATLRGFGGESYGDHLLRIMLREQAWLGRLIVSGDGRLDWAFADVAGNPVAASQVLRSPDRLAAVYFVDQRGAGCGTLGYIGSAFREYFVCNEAMVESYELYTAEVRAEIERSVSALAGLRQAVLDERVPGDVVEDLRELAPQVGDAGGLEDAAGVGGTVRPRSEVERRQAEPAIDLQRRVAPDLDRRGCDRHLRPPARSRHTHPHAARSGDASRPVLPSRHGRLCSRGIS